MPGRRFTPLTTRAWYAACSATHVDSVRNEEVFITHQRSRFMAESLRIEPAEASRRVAAGQAIILDVVSPMAWEQLDRAIKGALRISPDELQRRWRELPQEREIIAYCT
jgi:hypothetical protein